MGNMNVGFALTGSYCTFNKVIPQIEKIKNMGYNVIPIVSDNVFKTDTRFTDAKSLIEKLEDICKNKVISTIKDAEPIGPKNLIDALIIAPCTGNTLAKLSNGITDTSVTMATKATLRNLKPIIIAVSTNDGLGNSLKNIGVLLNYKGIFFVPFNQDAPFDKPRSLVANMDEIDKTLLFAIEGKQIQPIIYEK
ncbi:MAG: dipicolinate synthase subunit B [Ruminococcaceae bacterium]|nr:dipicolinate synthase subunit B [Oscillospiraceae bacterium]